MTTERPRPLVPWPGLAIAALTATAMAAASVIAWPDMAAAIVTREAGGNHGASVVPRGVTATLPPLALLVVAFLLAFSPELDRRLRTALKLSGESNPRGGIRVLNGVLCGLAVFFLVFHLGLLSGHTGDDFPFDQAVPAAAGVLIMVTGVVLPVARPDDTFGSETLERARRVIAPGYRTAAFTLTFLGLLTIVTALLWPRAAVFVGGSSVMVAALVAGVRVLLTRRPARSG